MTKFFMRRICFALFLSAALVVSANVKMPKVFGDHMVLQAGQPVPVWGWARPGEKIVVRFAGQEKHAIASAPDGRWEVRLDPLSVSAEPAELTVAGTEMVTFKDVLVGEVWLCSGQSNMEKPLGQQRGQKPTLNCQAELAAAQFPHIRFLKVRIARRVAPAPDFDPSRKAGKETGWSYRPRTEKLPGRDWVYGFAL